MNSPGNANDSQKGAPFDVRVRVATRRCHRTVAGLVCVAAFFVGASPAAGEPSGAPAGGAYTTNGPVWALARAGGRTYIGGDFTRVGVRSGAGAILSSTDGSRQTFPEVAGGDVRAVVSDGDGGWYIGGSFSAVGGQPHLGLAHIKRDGSVDSGFNPGTTDLLGKPAAVDALAFSKSPDPSEPWPDEGTLYVGGEFLRIGTGAGQPHKHVAALNGSDGSPITRWGPVTDCTPQPGCSAAVRTLAVAHVPLTVKGASQPVPVVFAGGDFNQAGPPSDQMPSTPGVGALWGVGALDSNGTPIGGSLVTDSSSTPWAPLAGTPVVQALELTPGASAALAVYVGGRNGTAPLLEAHQFKIGTATSRTVDNTGTLFSKWTPTPQNCDPAGCVPSVDAFALRGSTLYFGGDFSSVQGQTGRLTAKRVATIQAVPDPTQTGAGSPITARPLGSANARVGGMAVSNDGTMLYLGGDLAPDPAGQPTGGLAALRTSDGASTGWAPAPDAVAEALATDPSTTFVYAGGDFSSLGSVARAGLAAFDSSDGLLADWSPGVTSSSSSPPLVRALAASGTMVYVGGQFDQVAGQNRQNLAALDGVSGTPVDTFAPNPSLSGGGKAEVLSLSVLGSTLYVGGRFDHISLQNRQNLAALDSQTGVASEWNPAPDGNVHAVLPTCGQVYVGGEFTSVRGQPRSYVAAVDPATGSATTWDPNADGAVLALATSGPTIYAGGNFANIGGQLRQKAAELTMATGSATGFDPGANGPVRALVLSDGALYVGGTYNSIGGAARANLAAVDPSTGQANGWDPGADGTILALALGDDELYAGGEFEAIGSTPQRGFAPFTPGAGPPFVPSSCVAPESGARAESSSPAGSVRSVPGGSARSATACAAATPPRISRLAVIPRRVRAGGAPLTVRFALSGCTTVHLRFERGVHAHCPIHRLREGTSHATCIRYVRFAEMTGAAHDGVNSVSFPRQRLGRRRFSPGHYRVRLTTLPLRPRVAQRLAYFTVTGR
jgi:hypothetical protein